MVMRPFPLTPDEAFERLVRAYLDPTELWYITFVDRRERALFCTANRHYLALDDEGPIDPDLDRWLTRWEERDPDLLIVPRMPEDERASLTKALIDSIRDPQRREALEERRDFMLGRPGDAWRPGTLESFADSLDPDQAAGWTRQLEEAAARGLRPWLEAEELDLKGYVWLDFG